MGNSINYLGTVGTVKELKELGGDKKVLEFSTVHDTGFGDNKEPQWYNCKIWGKFAEALAPHINKGKQALIRGELTLRKYTNKDGVECISPEVLVKEIELARGPKEEQGAGDPF